MVILKIIILSCTINGNVNKKCLDKTLNCYDEYFSQMLSEIKWRGLGHCISHGLKEK